MKEYLLRKIENREVKVGVVGLGYVGLPLAVEKAKAGFKTIGFDVQKAKVDLVNSGTNYIGDVVDDDLKEIVENGMLQATNDFEGCRLHCHLCPYSAGQASAAGHQLRQVLRGRDRKVYDKRNDGSIGIHNVSRNDRRTPQAYPRIIRIEVRGGFLSGILSGTG